MVKTIADTLYIYGSAPVLAIMDAASIMHVGSIAGDQYLLVEARKRYSFAVHGLRLETAHKESETALSGVLILALGIMANHVMCPELHTTLTMRAFVSSSQKSFTPADCST